MFAKFRMEIDDASFICQNTWRRISENSTLQILGVSAAKHGEETKAGIV
jgi:hypothetical protein